MSHCINLDSFMQPRGASAAAMTCMHTACYVNASPSCTYHRRRICTRQLGQVLLSPWASLLMLQLEVTRCKCAFAACSNMPFSAWASSGVGTLVNSSSSCSSTASPAGAQSHDSRMRMNHEVLMLDNSSHEAGAEVGRLQAADTPLSQASLHST